MHSGPWKNLASTKYSIRLCNASKLSRPNSAATSSSHVDGSSVVVVVVLVDKAAGPVVDDTVDVVYMKVVVALDELYVDVVVVVVVVNDELPVFVVVVVVVVVNDVVVGSVWVVELDVVNVDRNGNASSQFSSDQPVLHSHGSQPSVLSSSFVTLPK